MSDCDVGEVQGEYQGRGVGERDGPLGQHQEVQELSTNSRKSQEASTGHNRNDGKQGGGGGARGKDDDREGGYQNITCTQIKNIVGGPERAEYSL